MKNLKSILSIAVLATTLFVTAQTKAETTVPDTSKMSKMDHKMSKKSKMDHKTGKKDKMSDNKMDKKAGESKM
ncbi:hypothetical protein MUY27_05400 [Mucilaginibacter sp. RS28]|uniref:Pentapeptide MXKDX repeat protein n=1 Tax=Mucilaginibacter straminoryzae TaxID=2932774 RepID=A0A9X1X5R5_9SPHI|nr:hypothetical protein [Mucilaginibacter straminoryzae]MCJ8209134.1 hypothetical protein [Mucilaginibacter straminoryzae]